jgi:hypothetical protein
MTPLTLQIVTTTPVLMRRLIFTTTLVVASLVSLVIATTRAASVLSRIVITCAFGMFSSVIGTAAGHGRTKGQQRSCCSESCQCAKKSHVTELQ